ncbi:hypothetical protein L596_016218 [Steinernema carpocapsae]|nr:hypothetical protein L596_016218 [Steinernema carpocapsae]
MTSMWDACISRSHLLSQLNSTEDTSVTFPFTYVQMWKHLEFICNAGSVVVFNTKNFKTLLDLPRLDAYKACEASFLENLDKDPTNLCPSTQTFMDCANKAFDEWSDHEMTDGWFACEEIRVGYADFCPHLRCYVLQQ